MLLLYLGYLLSTSFNYSFSVCPLWFWLYVFCVIFWSCIKNFKVHIWLFTLKILLWVWHQLGKASHQQEVGTSPVSPPWLTCPFSEPWEYVRPQSVSLSNYFWELQRRACASHVAVTLPMCCHTAGKMAGTLLQQADSLQWSIQLCSWRTWPLDVECGVILFPWSTRDMEVLPQGPQLCPGCHGALLCLPSVLLHRPVLKASLSSANVKGCLWGTSLDMFLNRSWSSGSQCWL